MAPHGSVAVVPLITTRSSGGVTMDVRSEKTRVATQTKPRACASLPRGSGLPAWRRKLPDSSSLGKTHVNGSTQRRRGGGSQASAPSGPPRAPRRSGRDEKGASHAHAHVPHGPQAQSLGSRPGRWPCSCPPLSARPPGTAASSRSSYSSRRPRGGRGVSTPCFREPTLRLRNATAGRAPPGW